MITEEIPLAKRPRRLAVKNKAIRLGKKVLGLLVFSFLGFVALGSWAVGSSVGSSPDDQYHMASIWCTGLSGEKCAVEEKSGNRIVPAQLMESLCTTQNPMRSANCQPLLYLNDGREKAVKAVNTRTDLYPPGYYATMNLFVQDNFEVAILSMRLLNVLLFVFLAVGAILTLPSRLSRPLVWGSTISFVPLGLFLVGSINPSSWALMSVGMGWVFLLGFLESRGWKSIALASLYVLTALMAFSSRTDSAVFFLAASALAVFLSPVSWKSLAKRVWLPLVPFSFAAVNLALKGVNGVGQLGVAVEGMGTRSLEKYGEPLPWAKGSNPEPTGDFDWELLWNNIWDVPGLWLGFIAGWPFGSLGWLDTLLPQFVPMSMMFALAGIAFISLRRAGWKKLFAVSGIVVSAWILPVYILQLGGLIAGEKFQPRYLLPVFTILVILLLMENRPGSQIRWIPRDRYFIFGAVSLANAVALHTQIRRYVTGFGSGGLDLDSDKQWWWFSLPELFTPNAVWLLGSAGFAFFLYFVVLPKRNSAPKTSRILDF